jgi:serine/threonine protein kinase
MAGGAPEDPTHLTRLGNFRVLKVLGEGGMGKVLLAEDTVLERRVAIKVMRPHLAVDKDARDRFLREGRAAAAINHAHVVPIHQVGEQDGMPFLVMPLLEGETLEARLKREGALPVAEVLRIGREAAEGLAAAHERGLVHRDIKPGNLWLEGKEGSVKVLDFGLVHRAGGHQLTAPGMTLERRRTWRPSRRAAARWTGGATCSAWGWSSTR